MNQEKIGKFIAKMRKEKNMTQQELADKLNVTDRAIGNWENGRRMPDVVFYKPLCEALDISLNELLSGERIDKKSIIKKSEENIINSLSINEKNMKKSKRIIEVLLVLIVIILFIVINYYKNIYPKFDIYNIAVSTIDNKSEIALKKQAKYKNTNIWYYGIDLAELCDGKDNCYKFKSAIEHNQTSIDNIKKYLDSQYELNNIKKFNLWDGGTVIYSNSRYSIIFCNTLDGNKDVYIGTNDMVNKLNNGYCGHAESKTKQFTRTYYIVSATDDDEETYINVTLKAYQGETAIVKLDKSTNINVGKNYEFTFVNYYEFDDTIKNIFEYSTIVGIKETSKVGMDQINESIYINSEDN